MVINLIVTNQLIYPLIVAALCRTVQSNKHCKWRKHLATANEARKKVKDVKCFLATNPLHEMTHQHRGNSTRAAAD